MLIQCNIPDVVAPFCFNTSTQIRWESKSFLALLYQLIDPSHYSFLRLSPEEINLTRLCFLNAATSNDHNVILNLGNSKIMYSALELAIGIAGLTHHHKANRAAFDDPDIFAATYNLLATGSMEEKLTSIKLMSNLVHKPRICSIILENHPDVLEVLQSLSESNEVGDSLKQDSSKLLKMLLDGVSGIISTLELEQDTQGLKPTTVADAVMEERKMELNRLLIWATKEMSKSRVLHNAADDDHAEAVLSMIFLTSYLREMSHFEDSHFSVGVALKNNQEFLSVLQHYTQRHFISTLKQFCNSACIEVL